MEQKAITFGSLFAGVGGFDLGFERAGMVCKWQVEIDDYASKVLAKHWPGVRRWYDVKTWPPKPLVKCRETYVEEWYRPRTQMEAYMAGKLKKLTPEQAEECVLMYQSGLSLSPIADYFNVSRQAMWDLLRRRIELRPQKRTGADNHFYRGGSTEDDHAQNMVEYAIRQGVLVRPSRCEQCGDSGAMKDGRTRIQAHHCDYNKPLEVKWLCQKCHHMWHQTNTAKRKEVVTELSEVQVDVICGGFP